MSEATETAAPKAALPKNETALPKTETAIVAAIKRHVASGAPRAELWDANIKGLSLVIGARSSSWFGVYADATGKRRRARIGAMMHPATGGERAPFMGLADAREAFAVLKGEARQSRDPLTRRDDVAASMTVAALVDDYLKKHASRKASHEQIRIMMQRDVVPAIGERRVLSLTKKDVHAVLNRALDRGAPIAANRTLEAMRGLFRWAVERDLMTTNPVQGVRRPVDEKPRARVLSDGELLGFWREIDDWPNIDGLSESVVDQFKLLALTGCREREIGGARWDEVDFERRTLTLPADIVGRSKGRDHPHTVPLSAPAVLVLKRLKLRAGRSAFVFPSPSIAGDRPAARSRVGNAHRLVLDRMAKREGVSRVGWRIHDLRRTVRSRLSELKVPPHVAELVIGHSLGGIVKIYDRYSYLDEKREALDAWAEWLIRIVGAEQGASESVARVG